MVKAAECSIIHLAKRLERKLVNIKRTVIVYVRLYANKPALLDEMSILNYLQANTEKDNSKKTKSSFLANAKKRRVAWTDTLLFSHAI